MAWILRLQCYKSYFETKLFQSCGCKVKISKVGNTGIKKTFFLLVRSLVFKKGQFLEVSHNFLKDASTIDASEYTSMTIFCNYAQKGLKDGCKGQTKTNGLLTLGTSIVGVSALLASLNTLFGHFWWLILIVVAGMVSCSTS